MKRIVKPMQVVKNVKWTPVWPVLLGTIFWLFVYGPAQAEKQVVAENTEEPAPGDAQPAVEKDAGTPPVDGSATNAPEHIVEDPAPSAVKDGIVGAIDFDTLKTTTLNRQPPPVYQAEVKSLDGKTIKIVGFMGPYDDFENLKNFMLFNKPVGCNFCQPPSVKEVVMVRQKVDKAKFIDAPIIVEGTLRLWKEKSEDEGHKNGFLYVMEEAHATKYEPEKK